MSEGSPASAAPPAATESSSATAAATTTAPKIKTRLPHQRACNEKNEKGKLCAGHLKRWYGYGDDIKKKYGPNPEIYRCEHCHTIYLPAPGYESRTGTLQF